MFLIRILIIFFIILIGFQFVSSFFTLKEGLTTKPNSTYKPYNVNDPNNALILSQQNAGNIEYLKGRLTDLDTMKGNVDSVSKNMSAMQTQIDALVQQQAQYANDIAETSSSV